MSLLALVSGLCRQPGRAESARALAAALGVEELLLFVKDPALQVLLPAPGMAQTLHGGPSWREFVAACPLAGRHSATVELPRGTFRAATALALEGSAVILVGGPADESSINELEIYLPLLSALLHAEQQAVLARDEAQAALERASRAEVLTRALESARADASALNAQLRDEHRRKDEFLAMLGHELRNPLSPLVSSVELLKMRASQAAIPRELTDIMSRQLAQLSRLVDDLLDVSRVSRGKIELRREPVDLREVVEAALDENRQIIESRRHQLSVHGEEQPLVVDGDRARLVQIFGNLINNAAKYTDIGGTIEVTLARRTGEARVTVRDSGIGIAPEIQDRIFDIFAQAPGALHRGPGGLGLGLTVVRTLVELHGGAVRVESAGEGQGSAFIVSLPVAAAEDATPKGASVAPVAAPSDLPLHVFVVDDNHDAADSIVALLRLLGHHAEAVHSAEHALASPLSRSADLMLVDIGMPVMNGYELARALRPRVKRGARLVALTGYGGDDVTARASEAGFDERLVKPLTTEALQSLLLTTSRARQAAAGR